MSSQTNKQTNKLSRQKVLSNLRGILVPIVTPMDADGRILYRAFEENLRHMQRLPLAGFVVGGSTGELPFLRSDERLKLFAAARRIVRPPQLVVAVTGLESTVETLRLSLAAEREGADCLLVITPHYFRPKMTTTVLRVHYETLADAVTAPLAIYSIPQFTGVKMEAAAIGALSRHPNIVGIKESSGDLSYLRQILRRTVPDFRVWTGSPPLLMKALKMGAAGGILGVVNYVPELCLDISAACRKKQWEKAGKLQRKLTKLNQTVNLPFGVPGAKAAMDYRGWAGGMPRAPLLPLTPEERLIVEKAVQSYLAAPA